MIGRVPLTFLPSPQTLRAATRLERHVEWYEGFWLAFVFTTSPPQAHILQNRLDAKLRARGKPQRVLRPDSPAELETILEEVLVDRTAGCTWVEAVRGAGTAVSPDAAAWRGAWVRLTLRANERRELLRDTLAGGLVCVAHPDMKSEIRNAGPDLWSVRSFVFELPPSPHPRPFSIASIDRGAPQRPGFSDPTLLEHDLRQLAGALTEKDDAARARITRAMATRLQAAGRYAEAAKAWGDVVDLHRSLASKQPDQFLPDLAASLERLGEGLMGDGRYGEAEQAYLEALSIQERLHGTHEHVDVATCLASLAGVLTLQGRYAEAEQAYRDALCTLEREYGTRDHVQVAGALSALAGVLTLGGRYDEAEHAYRDAISIYERAYGTRRHPSIATSLSSLAHVLARQGRYAEADQAQGESLAIEDPDRKLLEKWQQGDRDAGSELFGRYIRRLERYFRQRLGTDAHESQDLVQTTVSRVIQRREHIRSFSALLFGAARSVASEYMRERQRRDALHVPLEPDSSAALDVAPDLAVLEQNRHRFLFEALQRLPPDQREIVDLYYWQHLTAREIGEILGIPEHAVRSQIRAALSRLATLRPGPVPSNDSAELEDWLEREREREAGD